MRPAFQKESPLAINFPAMADGKRMNDQPLILNFTDDAKVTNTVTPQTREFAAQRLTKMPGIARTIQPVFQPIKNTCRRRTIKLRKLLLRECRNLNRPGQAIS